MLNCFKTKGLELICIKLLDEQSYQQQKTSFADLPKKTKSPNGHL